MENREEYTNEKIYQHFFEEYSEEYRNILDEILQEEKLKKVIIDIIKLEDEQIFGKAYIKAHQMMYIMLDIYIVPRMPKKEDIDEWDIMKYLFLEGEDDIAYQIISTHSHKYIYTEHEDAGLHEKCDVDYIIHENCHLYKLLLDRYGESK